MVYKILIDAFIIVSFTLMIVCIVSIRIPPFLSNYKPAIDPDPSKYQKEKETYSWGNKPPVISCVNCQKMEECSIYEYQTQRIFCSEFMIKIDTYNFIFSLIIFSFKITKIHINLREVVICCFPPFQRVLERKGIQDECEYKW